MSGASCGCDGCNLLSDQSNQYFGKRCGHLGEIDRLNAIAVQLKWGIFLWQKRSQYVDVMPLFLVRTLPTMFLVMAS